MALNFNAVTSTAARARLLPRSIPRGHRLGNQLRLRWLFWAASGFGIRRWACLLVGFWIAGFGATVYGGIGADSGSPTHSPAQEGVSPPGPVVRPQVPASPTQRAVKRLFLNGTIAKVNLAERVLELRTSQGTERLYVPTNASVQRAMKPGTLGVANVGDHAGVVARQRPDGSLEAVLVRLGAQGPELGPGGTPRRPSGKLSTD